MSAATLRTSRKNSIVELAEQLNISYSAASKMLFLEHMGEMSKARQDAIAYPLLLATGFLLAFRCAQLI